MVALPLPSNTNVAGPFSTCSSLRHVLPGYACMYEGFKRRHLRQSYAPSDQMLRRFLVAVPMKSPKRHHHTVCFSFPREPWSIFRVLVLLVLDGDHNQKFTACCTKIAPQVSEQSCSAGTQSIFIACSTLRRPSCCTTLRAFLKITQDSSFELSPNCSG